MALDKAHLAEVHLEHAIIQEALGNPDGAAAELERALQYEGPVKVKKQIQKAAKSFAKAAKKTKKEVAKVTKAVAKKTYGKRSSGGRGGKWMCEKCGSTFGSQSVAEAHEAKHRGKTSFKHLTVRPHKSLTEKCKHCGKWHSTSQHASHGKDSFENTHPGRFEDEY